MPSLSPNKLYTHGQMLKALLSAGQFAHIGESELARELSDLYKPNVRIRWDYADGQRGRRAVPDVLLKAVNAGLMPMAYDAATVEHVAQQRGRLCALCLQPSTSAGYHTWVALRDFVLFVAPSNCRIDYTGPLSAHERQPFTGSLCVDCLDSLWARELRRGPVKHPNAISRDRAPEALAWLCQNAGFRARVKRFAHMQKLLRFDPRRAESGARLAA